MSDPEKFFIAGTQRTGTTLLRTSLSSHANIVCHGEVFKLGRAPYSLPDGYWAYSRGSVRRALKSYLMPRRAVREYITQLFTRVDCSAVGFKVMLNHCTARPYLWPIIESTGAKAILMTRRNVLKTLVSRRAAALTRVYHVSQTLPAKTAVTNWDPKPVALDSQTVLQDLQAIENEAAEWRRRLAGREQFELTYEEYVDDPQTWNDAVQDFIGVTRNPLTSDLKKVNPDELRKLISNYDDISRILRTSRFSSCLDPR